MEWDLKWELSQNIRQRISNLFDMQDDEFLKVSPWRHPQFSHIFHFALLISFPLTPWNMCDENNSIFSIIRLSNTLLTWISIDLSIIEQISMLRLRSRFEKSISRFYVYARQPNIDQKMLFKHQMQFPDFLHLVKNLRFSRILHSLAFNFDSVSEAT